MPHSCALRPRPCYSYSAQERNSQTPRLSGFCLKFPGPLLKRKNLIGRDDPVPDSSKLWFNVLCYMVILYGNHDLTYHAIWSYYMGYMVLCYMIILYGNRALTYYAIWSSLVLHSAPWQNYVNRVPTGTKQHKTIPNLNVLCYMNILWMDYMEFTAWCSLTYHTYILTIRGHCPILLPGAPWFSPWCSLILRRILHCNYDHVILNLVFTDGEEA